MLNGLKRGATKWLVEALGGTWTPGAVHPLDAKPGFDHVRNYKNLVVLARMLVWQPYEAEADFVILRSALKAKGITVQTASRYRPARTCSAVFWRREDEGLAREVMRWSFAPFELIVDAEDTS